MFKNIRQGSQIYILHKSEPKLTIGEVSNVSIPLPQLGQTYTAGVYNQPKTTVDIKVKVGDEIIDYQKIPSDMEIVDFGSSGMVISESKESILTEIELLKKNSENLLNSVEKHRQMVTQCNSMIEELNPQVKLEAERNKEFEIMKDEMKEIKKMLADALKK